MRALIPSEQLLNNHAAETFRDYNTEQMIQVLPPQNKHQVCLIWGCSTLFLAITSILFYNLKKKKKVIFCTLMSSGNFGWNDRTMYNRMHAYFHFITPHSSFTPPTNFHLSHFGLATATHTYIIVNNRFWSPNTVRLVRVSIWTPVATKWLSLITSARRSPLLAPLMVSLSLMWSLSGVLHSDNVN